MNRLMNVEQGLMPGQVLQRNRQNTATALVRGTIAVSGVVECRICRAGGRPARILRGFDWQPVGNADGLGFVASIAKIPAGGPYAVSLRIRTGRKARAEITVDDVFVGDVWLLGGQSNMEGIGKLAEGPRPHPRVRAFFMRDEWAVAEEPINFVPESLDKAHNGYGAGPGRPPAAKLAEIRRKADRGVTPALFFALEMQRRTGVPQGLVPCALGGTTMEQWSPELREKGGASFYGAMMRRFEKLGQPVAGMLWYQGESDSTSEQNAAHYTERMKALVAALRRDTGQPRLPWLMAQLGRHVDKFSFPWNNLQEQQRLLPEVIATLATVPTVDLEIDDPIHICSRGQAVLGRRFARAAERLVHGNRRCQPAIAYAGCQVTKVDTLNSSTIRLNYRHVVGGLRSEGRPHGFTLHDAAGAVIDRGVCKVTLAKDAVILVVWLPLRSLPGCSVSYGYGMNPYCNITDGDGMGLPAMLRQPLEVPDVMPFALHWQSALIRPEGGLMGICLRDATDRRDWKPCEAAAGFVALPCPLGGSRAGTYAMKTVVRCAATLTAELEFGADSPFILWLNGKKVLEDPTATSPVAPEEYRKVIKLKKGENELVAVVDTRNGAGWGLCMSVAALPGKPSLAGRVIF